MSSTKFITVLMPVYNAEAYLREAIESILDQTYENFEFLIINDGSTDHSEQIIFSYTDSRIRYIKNQKNLGLSPTLNIGLKIARGEYIARMDADDISHPERLEKQVAFLDKHPACGVVGCMYLILDEARKPYEVGGLNLRADAEIKLSLFSNNIFRHGETMFRKSLVDQYAFSYNALYNPCEDYNFWVQMSFVTKFHILEDPLYYYMINPSSMSGTRWNEMKKMIQQISKELQQQKILPQIDRQRLLRYYNNGKRKIDGKFMINNQFINTYQQLIYQEFLFRTGVTYLKHIQIQGLLFLWTSFAINPANWLKKPYRTFFKKHERSKKLLDVQRVYGYVNRFATMT